MISIAIDGPSGAGKSTLSKALAKHFGFVYVDTGALYRTIGLGVLRAGKNTKNADEVAALLPSITVTLGYQEGEQRVYLNGEDVSQAIRQEQVGMAASDVSAHPAVRAFLLDTQRRLAKENNVIMDGRDIGTVVLPDATLKIYLTASVDDRATRRYKQLVATGQQPHYDTIKQDVIQRDYNDTHRDIAPLRQAEDAVLADTTGNEFEQSLGLLRSIIQQRLQQTTANE